MGNLFRSLVAGVVFAAAATVCFGQFETADLLGTILDPSGSPVQDARIKLLNQGTAVEVETKTNGEGEYTFTSVKPGLYTVTAESTGFSKAVATDIKVDVNARQRVDLKLSIGEVSDTVQVTDAAAALETDSSEHGQIINTKQVVELPLNGRNYSDLALLSTNVHRSPISVLFAANGTPREGAFNVNGMRSTYNNFLLDGLDNNAYSPSNQGYSSQVVQPSPDAINEFKVITSNFSAEYGRVGGGVINTALRSGTNEFHGTAYEFLRNTELNATGFVFTRSGFRKPTLQRNQFGGTIGGPIVKNKLFFFADYEGFRQLQRYLNSDTIPNAGDRSGVLPVSVVNPLTGTVYRAGTQIPVAQLNPFAARVLGDLPLPNGPGRASNYQALLLVRDYSDKYDAKLDYVVNAKMTSFLRFSQRKDLQSYQPDIPGPSGGNGNGNIHAIQQQAAAGYNWTLNATSLVDARFGFSHVLAGKTPPYVGGASLFDLYGIPGLPTSPDLTGGLNTQSVSGFSQFGRQGTNPQFQNPTTFNPKVNYSRIAGNHSLKFGYEFVAIRTEVLDVNPLYGSDTYAGQFSRPTCAQLGAAANCTVPVDATSYNLADFYFGLPSTIQLGNRFVSNIRQHVHSVYGQDDYRVTPKLTLNLGLRWEFATPIWERDNNYTNFDPTTNTLVKATGGDLYRKSLVHPDYHDFGPRLGFAYSANAKTVLRGGYGISYSFFNRPGSAQEGINAPEAIFGLLSQTIPPGGRVPGTFLTTQNSFTTGISNPSNFNPISSNIAYIPADTKWPYTQSFLFSVQRQLTQNMVLELAYNGNRSLRLPIIADFNQAQPNLPGQSLGVQARRPIPTFGAITWLDPAGNNNYNGFSARLERRFGEGLYFLNSFTWSKALGDSEQALETYPGITQANPQNIRNLAAEKGPASFDVKYINVASVVYQLPFGKGRRFGGNANYLLDTVAGGWELNSIITANTGTPLNVYYSPSTQNDVTGLQADFRGQAFLRPNVSGKSISQSTSTLINNYFAGYSFTTPPASSPFGNLGRDAFRVPGLGQWDLAANKTFHIVERLSVQFRSEFFNVLNHTNFGPPANISTASNFGQIRTTYPARQIQFALKAIF